MRFDWEPRGERRKLKARVSVLASELIELMPPAGIVLYSKLVTAGFTGTHMHGSIESGDDPWRFLSCLMVHV